MTWQTLSPNCSSRSRVFGSRQAHVLCAACLLHRISDNRGCFIEGLCPSSEPFDKQMNQHRRSHDARKVERHSRFGSISAMDLGIRFESSWTGQPVVAYWRKPPVSGQEDCRGLSSFSCTLLFLSSSRFDSIFQISSVCRFSNLKQSSLLSS